MAVRLDGLARSWGFAVALACAIALGASSEARADGEADEAELEFQLGAERYRAGQYREALLHFLASNRLAPNRNVMFNVARTYERIGRFPEAYRWYVDAVEGETDPSIRATADEALARITPQVSVLDVSTTPAGATIYLNRKDLGSVARSPRRIALEPGTYRVIAELDGYEDRTVTVEARRGEVLEVPLALPRILGWVNVEAEPGTSVHVGDEDAEVACTAPCRLELPPGTHLLYFAREGYRIQPRQVQVRAGATATVRTTATARTGSILVTADVRDAIVEVDGERAGFTPVVVPNVPVGRRRVVITLRGYRPLERVVEVTENQQARLEDLTLEPLREVTAASRITESIEDAPGSISIVTADEIEAFRYPTIAEALRGTRGIALTYDTIYWGIGVRGLGAPNDYGNRLLVLSDGAVLNDNILYQSFTGFDGRVDLGEVERIEIVRGPGSVLYGTGAVSGVLNLVPRGPGEDTSATIGSSVVYGNVVRGRAGGQVNLGDDGFVRLSAAGAWSDGHLLSLPPDGTIVSDVDRMWAATAQGSLRYRDLSLQAFFTTREQHIPTGIFGTRVGDPGTVWEDTRGLLDVRYEPALGEKVRLLTRVYGNIYRFYENDVYDDDPPATTQTINTERYRGTWVGAEARVVATPIEELRVSAGAEVQIDFQASLEGSSRSSAGGDSTPYLDASRPYQIYAGHALVEWAPSPVIRATAGLRIDGWSTFGVSLNPRLTLVVRPTENDTLKVIAGRAFRAPSIYELEYDDGGETQVRPSAVPGNELGPESLYSVETEYRRRFTSRLFGLASVYFQWASDMIETAAIDPTDPDSALYYRNGDADRWALGGDVELTHEWHAGFMGSITYGFLETRFADLPADAGTPSRRVPFAPRHFGSARGVVPFGEIPMRLAARVTLEAPRRIDLSSDAETDTAAVADLVISGYVRRYGLRYAVGAYNVFDWQYDLPVGDVFPDPRMPQRGRTFLASLDLTF